MTPKQRIARLTELVRALVPDATVEVDEPARPTGAWFVDVRAAGQHLVVEFRPRLGFGLSSPSADSYGEGPDEFVAEEEAIADRIATLIRTQQRTEPQRVHLLQALREQRKVSQVALAALLGIRQPTVSKIERREDVALSTLRRYIEALGGTLQVTAQFADGRFEIHLDDDSAAIS